MCQCWALRWRWAAQKRPNRSRRGPKEQCVIRWGPGSPNGYGKFCDQIRTSVKTDAITKWVCDGDAAVCQITLDTCYYYYLSQQRLLIPSYFRVFLFGLERATSWSNPCKQIAYLQSRLLATTANIVQRLLNNKVTKISSLIFLYKKLYMHCKTIELILSCNDPNYKKHTTESTPQMSSCC